MLQRVCPSAALHLVPPCFARSACRVATIPVLGSRYFCISSYGNEVDMSLIVRYIHDQVNGTFKGIEKDLFEYAEILGYAPGDCSKSMKTEHAKQVIEQGFGVCPVDFDWYCQNHAMEHVPLENADDQLCEHEWLAEYDEYQSTDDIIKLARLRGAKIERKDGKVGGATQIKMANGSITMIKTASKTWNSADRANQLRALWNGGIRAASEDSDPRRHCGWCDKFQLDADIESCKSKNCTIEVLNEA
mmetsp:Transcript_88360/g.156432  ORF Transcript_88360/g.156432 Transcript_88360/m.156432 type:complete len:246 (-) Transcript_88360:53-790(-)